MEPDHVLLERLRSGDEDAFIALVGSYHEAMLRLAQSFVPNRSLAEEVVQDTWLAVLRGLGTFEERSTLKTWVFKILVNRAQTVGARERRTTPLDDLEAIIDATKFDENGYWTSSPGTWPRDLAQRFTLPEMQTLLRRLLDSLPERQRLVVTLRDVEGLKSADVCELLGVTEGNQRLLLHRGRMKLRKLLDAELKEAEARDSSAR